MDYDGMVGLSPFPCYLPDHSFICTSRFKLHTRLFPEASKHIGDELPSPQTDESCVDVFADFFSANDEDLWSSVDKSVGMLPTLYVLCQDSILTPHYSL